jgi:hypothetical protein
VNTHFHFRLVVLDGIFNEQPDGSVRLDEATHLTSDDAGPLAPLQVGSHVAVPFVRGSRNDGDRISLAIRNPTGEWHTFANAPAVIGAFGDTLVAIADPTANTLAVRALWASL